MKNTMFIAPPAAGKGTQADLVVEKYHIPHIENPFGCLFFPCKNHIDLWDRFLPWL